MFFFGAFFIIWLLIMLVGIGTLIFYIFYLMMMSRVLELCHPRTRTMNPGEVWMVFIPVFGLVWHFIMVGRIADSLAIEFRNRNLPAEEERPGYQSGITYLILALVPVANIISIVFLILYYNKMKTYKERLEQHNAMSGVNAFAFQQQQQNYPPQYPQQNYPPQNRY